MFRSAWDVIEYLVMTSLVNLSLGFALAIYLGRADFSSLSFAWRRRRHATPAPTEAAAAVDSDAAQRRGGRREAAWPTSGMVEEEIAAPVADKSHIPDSPPPLADSPATPEEPPLETNVLAGIEEFRSQLAQMKGDAGLSLADV